MPDGPRHPRRDGQRLEPQDQADPGLVRQAAALARPLHADLRVLDQPGRAVLRPADRRARSGAAPIAPPRSWRRPSPPTSTPTTPTRSRSAGPRTPTTSSPPSSASASAPSPSKQCAWKLRNQDTSGADRLAPRPHVAALDGEKALADAVAFAGGAVRRRNNASPPDRRSTGAGFGMILISPQPTMPVRFSHPALASPAGLGWPARRSRPPSSPGTAPVRRRRRPSSASF